MYFLGGANSLRGSRENQFAGNFIAWMNLEYRYIIGKLSRIYVFNDWGYYRRETAFDETGNWNYGYGAGVRLETRAGIIGIDYGLGKGDAPVEGKIHFRLRTEF